MGLMTRASYILRQGALRGVHQFLLESGWPVLEKIPSPLLGGDGNVEYLIAARKPG